MQLKASLDRIEEGIFEETGHLSEEYYETFLKKSHCQEQEYVSAQIRYYRSFKSHYPLISDWFEEDLEIRVGGTPDKKTKTVQDRGHQ